MVLFRSALHWYKMSSFSWSKLRYQSTLHCFCRRGIALASLGGPIYAIGGLDDNTCFSDVERYDIESDQWSTVAPMNTPRGGVGSVALIVSYTAPSRDEAPGTALVSTVWLRSALQHWLVLNCLWNTDFPTFCSPLGTVGKSTWSLLRALFSPCRTMFTQWVATMA